MSDSSHGGRDRDERGEVPSSQDEPLAALLRATGRRPEVPPAGAARVRAAVHAHWRAETGRRPLRRGIWAAVALAAAAMVLVTVGLGVRGLLRSAGPGEDAARVEIVERAAWSKTSSRAGGSPAPLQPGERIPRGAELTTEEGGRLALRLASGHSVRLDSLTRVRVLSGRALALDRGALYVDSSGAGERAAGRLEIRTSFGDLSDRGTQFEARLQDDSLIVRVREGEVVLHDGRTTLEVIAGQEVRFDENGHSVRRDLSSYGEEWGWVDGVAPMMKIEGRSLSDFLSWAARERGLACVYSSAEQAAAARDIRLNGSIDGMTVDEALASVLPACRMIHRIESGRLVVESTGEAPGAS